MSASVYVAWFFVASCAGWLFESVYNVVRTGHWEKRGFLYGPFCPIYGVGVVVGFLLFDQPEVASGAFPAFEPSWIERVREERPTVPILVTASGLFYYFEEERVLGLMRMLQGFSDVELLFDTVNKSGMTMMRKKHMKTVGHEDAQMFFYVDSASELVAKIGGAAQVLAEERFYAHIDKSGLKLSTKASMAASDLLGMVKMVHLKL